MKANKYLILAVIILLAFVGMAMTPSQDGGIRECTVLTFTDSIPDTASADTINGVLGTDFGNFTVITDFITIYDMGGDSSAVVCYQQVSNDGYHWKTLDSVWVPAAATAAITADSAMAVKDWSTYGKLYKYSRWINIPRDGGTVFSDSTITVHRIFVAE